MRRKILYFLGALTIAAVLFWAFSPRASEVETEMLSRGRFERSVEDNGWTRVRDRYIISSPLDGQLERVSLREGDIVQRGDVLARLRPVSPTLLDARSIQTQRERILSLQAQALAAESAVERTQVALRQAQSDTRRNEQLRARQFISAAQLDAAQLALGLREKEFDSASHQAQAARHALAEAQAMLRNSDEAATSGNTMRALWPVRSPVSGRVLRVPQQSEAVVAKGTPILEIGDPTQLEVIVDLLTEDAAQVREGMGAQLLNWSSAGSPGVPEGPNVLKARVRRIEPSAFTKVSALGVEEQRVNVVLDILSPAEQWRALGDLFRVDVRIPVQTADNALTAPMGALFPHGRYHALFILRAGRAVLKEVEVLARNGRQAWLRNALPDDTEVIVYPPPTLKDGDKVMRIRR